MTQILATLKNSGRAAVVALALGAATVTAIPTPAMAQPSFNFSIELGGGNLQFRRGDRDRRFCLSNAQVRRGLRAHGFRDIDIVRERNRNRVVVIARYGRSLYRLQVNRCSGQVRIIERIRRGGFPGGPRGGFGLQFNFGM
jgi:hypothetical protein